MYIPVLSASVFACSFLSHGGEGFVHSVYRKTINLMLDGQLLALQASGTVLSPISLISILDASGLDRLGIYPGDRSLITDDDSILIMSKPVNHIITLSFPGARVCTDCTEAFPGSLSGITDLSLPSALRQPLSKPQCRQLAVNIHQAISVSGTGGFALLFRDAEPGPYLQVYDTPAPGISGCTGPVPGTNTFPSVTQSPEPDPSCCHGVKGYLRPYESLTDPVLRAAAAYLAEAAGQYCSFRYCAASRSLCRLIGLGSGLTPGGDDFLCGVLAGLILRGMYDTPFAAFLRNDISDRLSDTNDISAAFLNLALAGQFSYPVLCLTRLPDPDVISRLFGAVGHSSGCDTLTGILFSLLL